MQHSQEFVEEIDSAEVRETSMITGDSEISRRSSHPEPYLTKSEVRLRIAKAKRNNDKQAFGEPLEPRNAPDSGPYSNDSFSDGLFGFRRALKRTSDAQIVS